MYVTDFSPGEVPAVPDRLVSACADRECVSYVGAGLSAPAGLPTWRMFVEQLLDWVIDADRVPANFHQALREALSSGQIDIVADSLVSAVGTKSPDLIDFLRKTFESASLHPTDTHRRLFEIPFAAVLTTNFDTLLEKTYEDGWDNQRESGRQALVYTHRDTEPLLGTLTSRDFFILKLYGTPERPETMVVAPAQYRDAVAGNLPFARFMDGLFASRTLLFVGCSLAGIHDYLTAIPFRGTDSGQPREHFALVEVAGAAWQVQADVLLRRYGIHVIPYQTLGDYSEVPFFLKKLSLATEARSAAHPPSAPEQTWLSRLTLTNIGPFEHLKLEFDEKTNVLLGDNGVGKSSILRAIAIALCGEDASAHGGRLIRTGSTNARTQMITSVGQRYDTTIDTADGTAQISTRPSRLLEAEGWLTLGFPALRLVTWYRSTESLVKGVQRPTSADVLPLAAGDPDTRLDRVKQWILDEETLTQQPTATEAERSRHRRLLKDFHAVIEELTPGLNLRFGKVDLNTRTVEVTTGDVSVPIEAISQGTAALLGWVGVLLQRMYDLYGDDPQPRERYALVLIDEIDAHMHPLWQQLILGAIRKTFPNIQIIATSHSALVVSGLQARQVTVLSRDLETGRIDQFNPDLDLETMRADQILTSPLFGLRSTRKAGTLIDQYTELAGKSIRSPEDEAKFQQLRQRLKKGLQSYETPEQRQVEEAVRTALHEGVTAAPGDAVPVPAGIPEGMAREIKSQLADLLGKVEPEG